MTKWQKLDQVDIAAKMGALRGLYSGVVVTTHSQKKPDSASPIKPSGNSKIALKLDLAIKTNNV